MEGKLLVYILSVLRIHMSFDPIFHVFQGFLSTEIHMCTKLCRIYVEVLFETANTWNNLKSYSKGMVKW